MRSVTPRDLDGHCPRCYLRHAICLCAAVPLLATRTQIVIVRHVTELWLTSNTGRLARLALSNATLLDYGGGSRFDDTCLHGASTWLLYPGKATTLSLPPPSRLVVLDGSFRQARRMYQRIPALRTMPELALLGPRVPRLRLREPPRVDGMSTIEAVALALLHFGEGEAAEALFGLYDLLVARTDALRGRQRHE